MRLSPHPICNWFSFYKPKPVLSFLSFSLELFFESLIPFISTLTLVSLSLIYFVFWYYLYCFLIFALFRALSWFKFILLFYLLCFHSNFNCLSILFDFLVKLFFALPLLSYILGKHKGKAIGRHYLKTGEPVKGKARVFPPSCSALWHLR